MRLHIPSLPHTQTTKDYSWCAYTEKVRKFANMMTSLGHEVLLYAGEDNEADCAEHVVCTGYTFAERIPEFDVNHPGWRQFAFKAIAAIEERRQPGDILCLIGGLAQKPIADAFPDMRCIEFGVGYEGTFTPFRVFESYAWMHTVYGHQQGAASANGNFYDAVIPNSFEAEDFPLGNDEGNYLLYIGRLIDRKGLSVVRDIVERTGLDLKVAGEGDISLIPSGADYRGVVGPQERAELMGNARCLLVPTLYVEPFGGVAVEAQLCGTPAITTDWGAFAETVVHGVTGYRCHTLREFCAAVEIAGKMDRTAIRQRAVSLYSTEVVKYQYEDYFARVLELDHLGWYT